MNIAMFTSTYANTCESVLLILIFIYYVLSYALLVPWASLLIIVNPFMLPIVQPLFT